MMTEDTRSPASNTARASSILGDVKPRFSSAVPRPSAMPSSKALTLPSRAPILIGSSSAILDTSMDQESYDTRFLQTETQSQTQGETQAVTRAIVLDDMRTDASRALDARLAEIFESKASRAQEIAAHEDDEDLPDINEERAKAARIKALKERKAALVAKQAERAAATERAAKKGKGRAVERERDADEKMDLPTSEIDIVFTSAIKSGKALNDDEDSDLEICAPGFASAKATPHGKSGHRRNDSTARQRMAGILPPRSAIKREESFASESQFNRAGRTFGIHSGAQTTVSARVETRPAQVAAVSMVQARKSILSRAIHKKASAKSDNVVSKKAQDRLLLDRAARQAKEDRERRIDDWQKRGGTLRHGQDTTSTGQENEDDTASGEAARLERTRELMAQMREDAAAADVGSEAAEAGDEDDADDEDYIGSGDEAPKPAAPLAGDEEEEWNSGDELGSASGDSASDASEEAADEKDASNNRTENPAVIDEEEEEEGTFRRPAPKVRQVIADDDEDDSPTSACIAPYIPRTEVNMPNISLTQAFDASDESGDVPPAMDGFSQMFAEGDDALVFDDSQAIPPTQTQVVSTADMPEVRSVPQCSRIADAICDDRCSVEGTRSQHLKSDVTQSEKLLFRSMLSYVMPNFAKKQKKSVFVSRPS